MIHRTASHRSGASLVEVLVGFGILGIGVTSVITLFPFSALTLGQALKDDRTTTCAGMADGQFRDIHMRYVIEPETEFSKKKAAYGSLEPYFKALDGIDPETGIQNTNLPQLQSPNDDVRPSYPVYIDPMGVAMNSTASGLTGLTPVGDNGETKIPRVNLNMNLTTTLNPMSSTMALRYCSLMDSLNFDENGVVTTSNGSMRELRYNYAWMVQRPANRDRLTLRMQVVVYNKRVHLYKPSAPETVWSGDFIPGDTTIKSVNVNAEVRKGTWVMDGTIGTDLNGLPLRHAEFYRVVSVTEANGTYTLEVHKPISRPDGQTTNYTGRLVVMPGVADVFECQPLTASLNP